MATAVGHLRAAGISNLNLDLIFGVPGSTLASWAFDLDRALELQPTHLSAYGLTYEPNTPLAVKESRGEVEAVEEDLEAAMYEHACTRLAAAGFERYEISNWAKPGQACRHNLLYWRNESWLAFGPSASGHLAGLRFKVVPRLGEWIESSDPWPLSEWEQLDVSGTFGEELMLGLRLVEGIERAWLDEGLRGFDADGSRRRAIEAALRRRPPRGGRRSRAADAARHAAREHAACRTGLTRTRRHRLAPRGSATLGAMLTVTKDLVLPTHRHGLVGRGRAGST